MTAVTSATPIVSASAVTAVRPGLRIALRRASEPAAPPMRGRRAADDARQARTPRANSPAWRRASLSRSAATGAIFVARRAGIIAASTVASVPTAGSTTIVRVASDHPVRGQFRADRGEQRVQARGERDADADAGGGREQADRQRLEQHRARAPGGGLAPTIRSSPNSFVRWATVIESELKIVNAPTRSPRRRTRAGSCAGCSRASRASRT